MCMRFASTCIGHISHWLLHIVTQLPVVQEFGRRPQKLLLKWRLQGQGYYNHNSRASASCNMPPVVQAPYQGAVQVGESTWGVCWVLDAQAFPGCATCGYAAGGEVSHSSLHSTLSTTAMLHAASIWCLCRQKRSKRQQSRCCRAMCHHRSTSLFSTSVRTCPNYVVLSHAPVRLV
jgi:hypothetical protein